MKDWNTFDENKARFKFNYAYTYMKDGIITCLSTEIVKDKVIIRLSKVGKGTTANGKKIVWFDEDTKQDTIDFIFMLYDFEWDRKDIKEIELHFTK